MEPEVKTQACLPKDIVVETSDNRLIVHEQATKLIVLDDGCLFIKYGEYSAIFTKGFWQRVYERTHREPEAK